MDLEGVPVPADAPARGACVKLERPEAGLVVLRLDPPHRKLAVLDVPLIQDLEQALGQLEMETSLRGLVITGRDPLAFCAGADIDAIEAVTDPDVVQRLVRNVQDLFERVAALARRRPQPVTTVAAVGGPVLGGAYELALACSMIVLCDHPSTKVGLPEVLLGILPGWGGCQRLPRRIGVAGALDAILSGRRHPPALAKRRGLVDRLAKPPYLLRAACDLALGRERLRRRKRGVARWLVDKNPLATGTIATITRRRVLAQTRGHYPAALAALDIVARAPHTPIQRGFEAEAGAVAELGTSAICKNLVGIFRMQEEAKKLGQDAAELAPIERAAVIGAGIMGGGIASLLAERGVATRLSDLSSEALDEALHAHRKGLAKKRRRRRLAPHEERAALDRLDAARGGAGLGRSQLVIEAVAERLEVKRAVLGGLAGALDDDAILATNTSSLSVDAIAEGLPHPGRVVGMHFFNPVAKMPLVEVVRGPRTSPETVARTARLAVALGKTPVVVADVAGFLVNRVLGPYLDEAVRLFDTGVDPVRLERLAGEFGLPMGPLELLDEVGFDIARHAAQSLFEAYGERMTPSSALQRLSADDRLGKKTGRGFYLHGQGPAKGGKKNRTLCSDLEDFQRPDNVAAGLDDEEVVDRMVLALANEAVRCLEEGVVESAQSLDLATIFGMGFPPFRGGVLRWIDARGAGEVVARLETIAAAPDVRERAGGTARFTPAESLVRAAADGTRFRG